MDFDNLSASFDRLVSHMESEGYAEGYIRRIRTEFNWIESHKEGNSWRTYEDVFRERSGETSSESTARNMGNALAMIARFDLDGILPDRTKRSNPVAPKGAYHLLNEGYRKVIDGYREEAGASGKKASTVYHEASNAACFLLDMQEKGLCSLSEVREPDAQSFFLGDDGRPAKSCSYRKNVSAVLKSQAPFDPECARVLLCLPRLREKRKAIQYLTEEESSSVRGALTDQESGLSLRDRAIGQLLFRTGMRGCDIAALRLDSVDWASESVYLRQQKTGEPLSLPLTATVGNAIYDYIVEERPDSDEPWIFLAASKPHGRLAASSMWNVAQKVFESAGIRLGSGDRRGTHVFRHRAATSMLGKVRELESYIANHSRGITFPRPSLGTMEGTNYHFAACRVKGNATSWSRRGATAMVLIRCALLTGRPLIAPSKDAFFTDKEIAAESSFRSRLAGSVAKSVGRGSEWPPRHGMSKQSAISVSRRS